jgi:hypothetical protein
LALTKSNVPAQQVAPSERKAAVVAKLEALLNRRAEKVRDIPEGEINSSKQPLRVPLGRLSCLCGLNYSPKQD